MFHLTFVQVLFCLVNMSDPLKHFVCFSVNVQTITSKWSGRDT